ncbi:MAG: hypothetical protein ACYDHH_28100 [Solirubrobacteraceae bacterium]
MIRDHAGNRNVANGMASGIVEMAIAFVAKRVLSGYRCRPIQVLARVRLPS